jgi:hypothetical protein
MINFRIFRTLVKTSKLHLYGICNISSNKNLVLVVEHDNNIKKNKFDTKLFFFILKKFSFFDPFWKNSYITAKK